MTTDWTKPAGIFAAVTPDDDASLARDTHRYQFPRYFLVLDGGDVVLTDHNGDDTTFTGVAAGAYLWCSAAKVKATGTTATDIIAFYE
jgi:hypothetical protein